MMHLVLSEERERERGVMKEGAMNSLMKLLHRGGNKFFAENKIVADET